MLLVISKKREDAIFGIFKDIYHLSGEFTHGDSPDFVGSFDGHTIGIEITEIYSAESLREREVQKERIVDRACKKAIKAGLPPLHVSVIFTGDIQKGRGAYLTNMLFELVKNNCPECGGHADLDYESNIPSDFHAILISNIPGSKTHLWNETEVGFVDTNFSERLQQIINSKTEKIATYLTKCDKCWLIVAALGVSASNFYEIDEKMEHVCYESPFEKVFFMEAFSRTLKELKIKSAEIGAKQQNKYETSI
jgi:hypothetical protein